MLSRKIGVVLQKLGRKLAGDQEFNNVEEMHAKFGFTVGYYPEMLPRKVMLARAMFIKEELDELMNAIASNDLPEAADALIDIVYVAKGTAVMMGLPWEPLWDDVHRANMTKEKGLTKRGMDEDLIKPPGWEPPDTIQILLDYGWVHPDDH
ncbi:Phosphoribosyl-ATP pyrophosphohydrolase-like [uncultured Caudovirales phage]|uniref:Phosphoribosyl-ATP pyrophosphohydrolase-like n=1 Tax=uncultured Caudovirales phage TaxID=2100421 RepID=A0A6J5M8B2_9CAUD|nr:Phosphoribosyl-ATP pyrophosphohydrolase-like [uncultured Caudovirales phage]